MAQQTITQTGAFTASSKDKINDNFTELYAGGSGGTFTNAVLVTSTATTSFNPTVSDATTLGDATHQFSDLFLAEGAVINWDNGDATITQTSNVVDVAGAALANSTPGTASGSVATVDGTQTLTGKTLSGNITSDYKVLAANATYTGTTTPATLTGFSWTVVPGTYIFELNMPTTMTTNGGLTINFLLTTAVLTSIQYESFAATADVAGTGVTTNGTTTTSGTKVFDNKTAAYTHVNVKGSMVVGTGGTFEWQGTQNTSAGGGDATVVAIGSYATLTRVA